MTSNGFTLLTRVLLIVAVAISAPLLAQEKASERGESRRDRERGGRERRRESAGSDSDGSAGGDRRRGERGRGGREHRERGRDGGRERGARGRGRSRGDRHERWKGFDDEKKQKIQDLHRRLGELPKDKHDELLKRLRAMSTEQRREAARRAKADSKRSPVDRDATRVRDDMLRRVWRDLSPDKRAELEAMEPEERHEQIKNMYRERRQRAMRSLPEALRQEIARLSEEEQVSRLRRYLAEKRVGQVFEKVELEKIRSLSDRELFRLLRPPARRGRPEDGGRRKEGRNAQRPELPRPEFISESSWERWNKLPRFEQPRLLRFIRGKMKPVNRAPHPGARRGPSPRGPSPRGPRRGLGPRDGGGPGSDRDRARDRDGRRPSRGGPPGAPPKPKERQRRKDDS